MGSGWRRIRLHRRRGYWIFALTLANHLKSDLVPPEKAASYIHAIIEANRKNYTENVVNKLTTSASPRLSNIGAMKRACRFPHNFSWNPAAWSRRRT